MNWGDWNKTLSHREVHILVKVEAGRPPARTMAEVLRSHQHITLLLDGSQGGCSAQQAERERDLRSVVGEKTGSEE